MTKILEIVGTDIRVEIGNCGRCPLFYDDYNERDYAVCQAPGVKYYSEDFRDRILIPSVCPLPDKKDGL